MLYVVLDPGADYAAAMIEFLARNGRQGIAVHTRPETYWGYHHVFEARLAGALRDEYLLTEHDDLAALAARIREEHPEPLEGILPWDERTTELGAALAEHLGIDWNPRAVIHRFRNKFAMKQALRDAGGVRVNASGVVHDEEAALAFARDHGRWPLVVKPTEGAGTRGVFVVEDEEALLERCREVFHLGDGEVLLEEYVGGTEYVVNGLVDSEGALQVTDVWRYEKRTVGGVPNLYSQSFKVNTYEDAFPALADYAAAVVGALGLTRAPIHMEVKLDEYGPCLIEVGARFAGGNHPGLASLLHGHSLFEIAACHYLARFPFDPGDLDFEAYDARQIRIVSGIQEDDLPIVEALEGLAEVAGLASFHSFADLRPAGVPLPRTVDLYTRSYVVYLIHEDPEQVEADAQAVRSLLRYR